MLNLWALDQNGYANDYYAAAVRAMSSSWHAFLYGSFDAAGVMTVDKPPLALWVQALSVRVFGFNSWALLVPQALMGVASVALVYDLVRRRFGRAGGFVGRARARAHADHRRDRAPQQPGRAADPLLASPRCGASCARSRTAGRAGSSSPASRSGSASRRRWPRRCSSCPGIVAAYLWVAPRGRWTAVRQLLAGGAAMVVVGGAWPALMALTPASDRAVDLRHERQQHLVADLRLQRARPPRRPGRRARRRGGGPGGGGGGVFGGDTGVFRLLDSSLGGQAGWLLGFAVVGGGALLALTRLRRTDARTGWLIAVGGAFAVTAVAFSFAQGIFHPYYVSLLAPFTAALVGGGRRRSSPAAGAWRRSPRRSRSSPAW